MVRSHYGNGSIEADLSGCLGGGVDGTAKDLKQGANISSLGSDLLREEREGGLGEELFRLFQVYRIVEEGLEPCHQDVRELL